VPYDYTEPRGGGLYIIWLSDTHYYGGRTRSYTRRWRSHLRQLQAGTHDNARMQNTFNKYGQFRPEVLCKLKPSEHQEAEQEWLDANYRTAGCVNLSPYACGGCDGHTEKTRAKMSKTRSTRPDLVRKARASLIRNTRPPGVPLTPTHREAISTALSGRKQDPEVVARRAESNRGQKRSEETRQRMSEAAKQRCVEHPLSHSEDTKALISRQQRGRVWINNGKKNRRVWPEEAETLVDSSSMQSGK